MPSTPDLDPEAIGDADRVVGRYEVRRALTVSDDSIVGLARRGDAPVVVKWPKPGARASAHRRIEREAEHLAAVRCAHVVRLLDRGEHHGRPYAVLEYLAGEDALSLLRLALERDEPIPPGIVGRIAADAAAGLHAIHESCRVVHGDVSPSNLFVTYAGRAVVLDLGAARPEGERPAGTVAGKAAFLAPEVIRGEPSDRRADVFALGATALELLTARRAFARETIEATFGAILDAVPVVDLAPRLAPDGPLTDAIRRALAGNPADRFASAGDFAAALDPTPHLAAAADADSVRRFLERVVDPDRRARRLNPLG